MSRHGYTEDCDDNLVMGRWQGQLKSSIRGKRGQAFLRALVAALDALPEKRLVSNSLETSEGEVCALGALARHRGIDVKPLALGGEHPEDDWEDSDWDKLASMFDVTQQLAREVMYMNDEQWCDPSDPNSEAVRWQKVRAWAARRIVPTEEELQQVKP